MIRPFLLVTVLVVAGCEPSERQKIADQICADAVVESGQLRAAGKVDDANSTLVGTKMAMGCDSSAYKAEEMSVLTLRARANLDRIEAAKSAAPKDTGDPLPVAEISVPTDARAEYHLISKAERTDGFLEVVTRRDGPSGRSYSRRIIDCDAMTFAYAGEGDSWAEFSSASKTPDKQAVLTPGSISTYVSVFACSR